MKLFSSTEVITNKEQQISRDLLRVNSIDKELNNKRLLLSQLEKEFEDTLKRQREDWEYEENLFIQNKNKLKTETEGLEQRKKQALIPLAEKENELDERSKLIDKILKELEQKNEDFIDSIEALEERLTEISIREQEADRVSKLQLKKKKGIEAQQEQISNQAKEFNDMMAKAVADISEKDSKLSRKETKLLLRENAIKEREIEISKIEKGFTDRERAITDKYNTLQRALNYNK